MWLVIKTDRSLFYAKLKSVSGRVSQVIEKRWLDIPPDIRPKSDLQRKYFACIFSLRAMRERKEYDFKLKVEGKLINEQLIGKKSTGTYEIAQLKSELIGLMTQMGVTIERNEIRPSKKAEERR